MEIALEGRKPGKANPDTIFPLSPTPPAPPALLPRPLAGAVQVISPERPARGAAQIPPFTGVIPYTGPWWQSPRGGAGEGAPSPSKRTILALL